MNGMISKNHTAQEIVALILGALGSLFWLVLSQDNEFDVPYVLFALKVLVSILAVEVLIWLLITWRMSTHSYGKWCRRAFLFLLFGLNFFTFLASALSVSTLMQVFIAMVAAVVLTLASARNDCCKSTAVIFFVFVGGGLFNFISNDRVEEGRNYDARIMNSSESKNFIGGSKNVYVVFFDALVSQEAMTDLYKRNELPWKSYFLNNGYKFVENAWAAGDATIPSFSRMFSFGKKSNATVTGQGNLVYEHFKRNGYGTSFFADSGHFGRKIGNSLDYFYPLEGSTKLCEFAPKYFLLGACRLFERSDAHEKLVKNLKAHIRDRDKSRKWLTVLYIWKPGHSPVDGTYVHDGKGATLEWSSVFESRVAYAEGILEMTLNAIRATDKDSVIVVGGDHGSGFFRNHNKNAVGVAPHISERLLKVDKLGVSFAVYPEKFCDEKFGDGYDLGLLFRDIDQCLVRN